MTKTTRAKRAKRDNIRSKKLRASLPTRPRFIRRDACRTDRKFWWVNDLTLEIVAELVKNGCSYCGGSPTEVKMSLDRIDNTKPHNQSNVRASCVNCNLTRGSMPYDAWLVVAEGMRRAREQNLLNGWLRRA